MKYIWLSLIFLSYTMLADEHYSGTLKSQESVVKKSTFSSTYREAKILRRHPPKYPRVQAYNADEGWVSLSFVVGSDATIKDIQVIDHSGIEAFIGPAKKAASKYKYKPASSNGVAVESIEEIRIVFQIKTKRRGVGKKFARQFRKFKKAHGSGEYEQALKELETLKQIKVNNLYQEAYLSLAEFSLGAVNKSSDLTQIKLLKSATRVLNGKPYISNEAWRDAILSLFILQAKTGQYGEALDTYESIPIEKEFFELIDKLEPYQKEIQDLRHNKSSFSSSVRLNKRGFGYLKLLKPAFTVSNLRGNVNSFRLSCESGVTSIEFREESEYKIPESFGECTLRIRGQANTSFDLVQLPISQ